MLTRAALLRTAPEVRTRMGKNAVLLDRLLDLLSIEGRANLAEVLQSLYPGETRDRALANLRQFRLEIEKSAKKAGISLQLSGDKKTRTPPEEREVWFEGEDRLMATTEQWIKPNIEGPPHYAQDAIKLGPSKLYVVYADADKSDACKLLRALQPHLRNDNIELWTHTDILPGEVRSAERSLARQTCDLTLQLLSPEFQAAKLEDERTARVIPILLHELIRFPPDIEIFRHKGKSFDKSSRRDFARDLFLRIQAVLSKHIYTLDEDLRALASHCEKFVDNPASVISLQRGLDLNQPTQNRGDALTFLTDWLVEPNAPMYCALLGELGMGKTTTVKELARRLADQRGRGASAPLPIYLDLRYVGDFAVKDQDLDEIIARILKRSWKGGPDAKPPESREIYRLVAQGALVIFDGLDEVLVHLTPSQGQLFTRQLFRILPPGAQRGRLLLTCRTHYFRTFQEQSAHFTMEDRDSVQAESYRALVLLPFGEEQIRTYLENSLPGRDINEVYDFISSVHNLPELAERPYTLNLITRQFARLEERKATGKPVTGLTLYRFVVDEWLLRDQGKHQFNPDHKQMLMEHVAAELLRSGSRTWTAAQLEQWLMDFLDANRRIASHYDGVKRDLLKEDLRTATFLVRDENGDQFRFAHTSLQEYFLACYLQRALEASNRTGWALRGVSRETLDFLGQSLAEQPSDPARKGLAALRDTYTPRASELAFRYFLLAHAKGYPAPLATGFQLPGADLFGLEVDHPGPGLLELSNLNLSGARITNTFWRRCRLTGADFTSADAARSEWQECDLSKSQWEQTGLEAALFRKCELRDTNHSTTQTSRTIWILNIGCKEALKSPGRLQMQLGHSAFVYACAWSPDRQRVASAAVDDTLKIWDASCGHCLLTLTGHSASVSGCAWSSDGKRVASSSGDGTLRIWDASSGHCLLTLTGHSSSVDGCTWSPDGQRVASCSWDETLKIWDASSGDCLLTLAGHSKHVSGCAWSPDGRRVVSSSGDKTLKIWDASSGDCLLTLTGHSSSVYACAWSPDGQRVVSSSGDQTLKIWDASSGDCLLTLTGHSSSVYACAWSPDGQRVVSSSNDKTLKIWDVASSDCLLTLTGHSSYVYGCAWSPDGQHVVSSSWDDTLKVWEVVYGDCLLTLTGHSSSVSGCAWSSDSERVVSSSGDKTLKIWDAVSNDCLLTLTGHSSYVSGCAWSPDGQRVVSSSGDQTLKIWDASSGDCLLTLTGHSASVSGCAWSPDGQRVVSSSGDQTLKIWDAASGDCLLTLTGHSDYVSCCAWSPNGQRVVSSSFDKTLKVWDAASGHCLLTLYGHSVNVSGCAWSPDGQHVVSSSWDDTLRIWDAASGHCLLILTGHSSSVSGCAWSPDGQCVVSSSGDKSLRIWDAASGDCLLTLFTHSRPTHCAWSADGRQILASFVDGSISIYDAATLTETGPRCYHLHPPHSQPTWASIDPVNNRLLAYGEDAWRSVGYVIPDETGTPMWLPIEAFTQSPE